MFFIELLSVFFMFCFVRPLLRFSILLLLLLIIIIIYNIPFEIVTTSVLLLLSSSLFLLLNSIRCTTLSVSVTRSVRFLLSFSIRLFFFLNYYWYSYSHHPCLLWLIVTTKHTNNRDHPTRLFVLYQSVSVSYRTGSVSLSVFVAPIDNESLERNKPCKSTSLAGRLF